MFRPIKWAGNKFARFLIEASRGAAPTAPPGQEPLSGGVVVGRTSAGNIVRRYPPTKRFPNGRISVMQAAMDVATNGTGEVGISGLAQYAGRITEEYNSELQSLDQRMVRFEEMRRSDLAVMENMIGLPIREATWRLSGGDDENFRNRLWLNLSEEMSHSFDEVLRVACLGVLFGFSIHEIVGETKWDGFEGLRKLAERSRSGVEAWEFDATGGVQGYWNVGYRPDDSSYVRQRIDIERLVLWTWRPDKGNPEGLGAFRQAFKAWRSMEMLEEWAGMHVERTAIPIPVFVPPAWNMQDVDADECYKIADRLIAGENQGIVLPLGWTLDRLRAESSDVPWLPLIEWQYMRMLQGIMGQFVGYGSGGQNAGAPLGKEMASLFLLNLNAIADWICETFNRHVIPKVWRWNLGTEFLNGGSVSPPKLDHTKIGLRDLDAFGRLIRALFDVNTIIPKATLLELLDIAGLAEPDEADLDRAMAIKERRGRGRGANEQAAGAKQPAVRDTASAENGLENLR